MVKKGWIVFLTIMGDKMSNNKVAGNKGWQTSEFWVAVITSFAALVNQSGVFGFQIPVETLTTVIAPVVAYIVLRGAAKVTGTIKADAKSI